MIPLLLTHIEQIRGELDHLADMLKEVKPSAQGRTTADQIKSLKVLSDVHHRLHQLRKMRFGPLRPPDAARPAPEPPVSE